MAVLPFGNLLRGISKQLCRKLLMESRNSSAFEHDSAVKRWRALRVQPQGTRFRSVSVEFGTSQ